jgi:hypothetical protein
MRTQQEQEEAERYCSSTPCFACVCLCVCEREGIRRS